MLVMLPGVLETCTLCSVCGAGLSADPWVSPCVGGQ